MKVLYDACGWAKSEYEFCAEKIIANAGSFALAIILFFGIYEVTKTLKEYITKGFET